MTVAVGVVVVAQIHSPGGWWQQRWQAVVVYAAMMTVKTVPPTEPAAAADGDGNTDGPMRNINLRKMSHTKTPAFTASISTACVPDLSSTEKRSDCRS